MSDTAPVKMVLITGFLGAGKTTLLNNLLQLLVSRGQRVGVIINEFGEISVDGQMLSIHDMEIRELNNGQIFCGCMAGRFVTTVAAFADLPLDYLLVETSGMANPQTIGILLGDVQKLTAGKIDYQGMICLVDAVDFLDLSETLMTIDEQVRRSQTILVNKADLVTAETLARIESKVAGLNPEARVVRTTFAAVGGEVLNLPEDLESSLAEELPGQPGREEVSQDARPKHYLLTTSAVLDQDRLQDFIRLIAPETYRIKGFFQGADGWLNVDAVRGRISIRPVAFSRSQTELVIISRQGGHLGPAIKTAWKSTLAVPMMIKENAFRSKNNL